MHTTHSALVSVYAVPDICMLRVLCLWQSAHMPSARSDIHAESSAIAVLTCRNRNPIVLIIECTTTVQSLPVLYIAQVP